MAALASFHHLMHFHRRMVGGSRGARLEKRKDHRHAPEHDPKDDRPTQQTSGRWRMGAGIGQSAPAEEQGHPDGQQSNQAHPVRRHGRCSFRQRAGGPRGNEEDGASCGPDPIKGHSIACFHLQPPLSCASKLREGRGRQCRTDSPMISITLVIGGVAPYSDLELAWYHQVAVRYI